MPASSINSIASSSCRIARPLSVFCKNFTTFFHIIFSKLFENNFATFFRNFSKLFENNFTTFSKLFETFRKQLSRQTKVTYFVTFSKFFRKQNNSKFSRSLIV
ncbi:hypothetical protein B9Z55_017595 [Caenorhabditis nigoni]|uniref:Uncharacterized protein n=1 Tax=Caenorhabditis nigoni TaxID=1611254 RepID=A0A2G5TAA1_9PELO|nr:hypothetical protein B9Z55_017595 [Caenorhabditis nigoni]